MAEEDETPPARIEGKRINDPVVDAERVRDAER